MNRTDTLVIGGGQAGLAVSRCLTDRGLDHVVLERARLGERWRSERWDSLRLLTPNWQTRLPGWSYRGSDPDGFMTRDEVVEFLEAYARSFAAPLLTGVAVTAVDREGEGFRVECDHATWRAKSVVVASGSCDRPYVPGCATKLSRELVQLTPSVYRNPAGLAPGGVLVVGASATGLQLADEIQRSGRQVTLAVGRHTRVPRRYRGRDIQWWLDAAGIWDETPGDVRNAQAAARAPSLQLIGSPDHRSLDLGLLQRDGVRLVGRVLDTDDEVVTLASDLSTSLSAADARLVRLRLRIDERIERSGLARSVPPAEPLCPILTPPAPGTLALMREGIRTVLWATGFRRSYPWLRVSVLDERGEIIQRHGITPVPGLYVLGMPFQRTRKSSLIDGVGADAAHVANHIALRQGAGRCQAA